MRRTAPDSPHPLSLLREEFVWPGKYDTQGNRRVPALPATPPTPEPLEQWDGPDAAAAQEQGAANLLLWGDNRLALAALLPEYRGRVQLIYIDPPFDTGTDHTLRMPVGGHGNGHRNGGGNGTAAHLELVAYRDTWGGTGASYLQMMYERLVLMRELLRDTGVLALHCDWRSSARLRLVLDEVFGPERFVNEIVWHYYNKYSAGARRLPRAHDSILVYARGPRPAINALRLPRETPAKQLVRENVNGVLRNARDADGRLCYRTVHDRKGDDVWRIPQLQPASREWTGHPTQKHHELLERIVAMGSREGDLVADFFCGAGTTLTVAERMGRRWIGCDQGALALHITRKRLLRARATDPSNGSANGTARPTPPPLRVASLAAAARIEWRQREFGGSAEELRRHLLAAFGAEPVAHRMEAQVQGYLAEGGALAACAVPSVDGPCTPAQALAAAREAQATGARRLYLLAWAYDPEVAGQLAAWSAGTGLAVVPMLVPQALVTPAGSAPPVFRALPGVEARWEPAADGHGGQAHLLAYRPGPARPAWSGRWEPVPQPDGASAEPQAAAADPLALLDGWCVDPAWRAGGPFRHRWWDVRMPHDRALAACSPALAVTSSAGGETRPALMTTDVWGLATVHLLPATRIARASERQVGRRSARPPLPSVSDLR